jgi:hypothetical protein
MVAFRSITVQAGGSSAPCRRNDVYFTDRGIEELESRRGDEQLSVEWLVVRMRAFVDQHPEFESAVERLATFLARDDADELADDLDD